MNIPSSVKTLISTDIVAYNIFTAISEASEFNPVEKGALEEYYGYDDRTIRKTVSKLREAGARIGSCSGKSGYWLCTTDKEYRVLRNEYISRIKTLAKIVRKMDRNLTGQIELEFTGE